MTHSNDQHPRLPSILSYSRLCHRGSNGTKRDEVGKSAIGEGGYVTESYYDDYTPDMETGGGDYYDGDSSPWRQSTTGGAYYDDDIPPRQSSSPQQQM
jgi:hypothetical protein